MHNVIYNVGTFFFPVTWLLKKCSKRVILDFDCKLGHHYWCISVSESSDFGSRHWLQRQHWRIQLFGVTAINTAKANRPILPNYQTARWPIWPAMIEQPKVRHECAYARCIRQNGIAKAHASIFARAQWVRLVESQNSSFGHGPIDIGSHPIQQKPYPNIFVANSNIFPPH